MTITTQYGLSLATKLQQNWGADFSIDFVVPLDLVSQWRRCGLISDFLANYHSFEFKHPDKSLSILSTTINELLENAVKFSVDKNELVTLSLKHINDTIYIETINYASETNARRLSELSVQLEASDPDTLFYEHLESAARSTSNISGIGILTIMKDYDGKLGLSIHPKIDEPQVHEIVTTIGLCIDVIDSA